MDSALETTKMKTAFLGVEKSCNQKYWTLRESDDRIVTTLCQRFDLSEVIARILNARGIAMDDVPSFLEPRLRDLLPNPSELLHMDRAVERITDVIRGGKKIGIFGDYDVDGATSSALFGRFVRAVGGQTQVHIPDRQTEGYGPNAAALLALQRDGCDLVVTLDCGATAHEPLASAAEAGLDVIVVDHHAGEETLPPAYAVVNPNRLDETTPYRHLAAVGVAFLLVVALNRHLRKIGWYTEQRREPDLRQWLDIVALGTVCDVMPLTGVNRMFVVQGLKVFMLRGNAGLRALADVAGVRETPGTYHLGFVLGPRINAGGRVGASDLGMRLLSTNNDDEAMKIALRLDELNRERQTIEAAVLDDALFRAENGLAAKPDTAVIVTAGEGWHPGVVGIVASRLKDRFNMPACVIAWDGDVGHGSGRSVPGVDLGDAIISARQSGLLLKGGGHAMAAGFSIERANLDAFADYLQTWIAARISEIGYVARMSLDGVLALSGVTRELIERLETVGPYGAGHAEPRFAFSNVTVTWADTFGVDHIRCMLSDASGTKLEGVAFRAGQTGLGAALTDRSGLALHVAGRVRLNTWRGNSTLQLLIDDAARVSDL